MTEEKTLTESQRELFITVFRQRQAALEDGNRRLNSVIAMIARENGFDDPSKIEIVPDENGLPKSIRQTNGAMSAAQAEVEKPKKTKKKKW